MISAALKLAASRAKALVPAGTGAYVGSKMAKGRDRLTGRNRRAPTAGVDVAEGHDRTNKLFGLQIGWDLFDRAMSKVNANAPTFTHSITVSCQGGPLADLRRVYYLALAAAFGRWSNGVAGELKGSTTSMVAHIDVTGKAVAVNISYTTLAADMALAAGKRANFWRITFSPLIRFIKFYFLRQGFRDGLPGLIHIAIGCFNSFIKYSKMLERQNSDAALR